jgi:hypothetical protein
MNKSNTSSKPESTGQYTQAQSRPVAHSRNTTLFVHLLLVIPKQAAKAILMAKPCSCSKLGLMTKSIKQNMSKIRRDQRTFPSKIAECPVSHQTTHQPPKATMKSTFLLLLGADSAQIIGS